MTDTIIDDEQVRSKEINVKIAQFLTAWIKVWPDTMTGLHHNHGRLVLDLPDYYNDLNAMYKAERTLNIQQWTKYLRELASTCGRAYYVRASSDKRAEAFVKAVCDDDE